MTDQEHIEWSAIRVRAEPWRKEYKATAWFAFTRGQEHCAALAYGQREETVRSVINQMRCGRRAAIEHAQLAARVCPTCGRAKP